MDNLPMSFVDRTIEDMEAKMCTRLVDICTKSISNIV